MSELLLIAASGLAREVLAMVRSSGPFDVIGILDDDEDKLGRVVDGAHVLGPIRDALKFPHALLLVCIGSGAGRESVVMRLRTLGLDEKRYATAIDPSVQVPEGCMIGRGSILLAHVSMTASVSVGNHVVAMPGVTFTHDDEISDFATFASGVSLGGNVHIGRAAYIGMNASVRERTSIGAKATIGMGAAVLTDVPEDETWAGVPARVIRRGNSPALEGIL
ncbi:sugar O-acyltransferase (sialic acid O-acetyltransferase NeuD family) [Paenarthrobacter nitroguajacolicus]|uniref:acetyltransferase n=1 Tax=Paenarthrobacter TaxID=1742992 RepID=UPI002859EACB|nr:acetyltransferase [Paenarthrobacter nitroguajacolicus]MDR6987271.1 sugar O-acyltransferase (sialic acid O-acetyltransferase NeuD family) [Paenarthrobacter nitroguajacolicus]